MAKLQLGKAPENFKCTVTFSKLDKTKVSIDLDFKYRTRKQYAELIDAVVKGEEDKKPKKDETKTFTELLEKGSNETIDFILNIATGWDLEDEFNRDNVAILVDEFPSATNEINEAYRVAILEGRLKN